MDILWKVIICWILGTAWALLAGVQDTAQPLSGPGREEREGCRGGGEPGGGGELLLQHMVEVNSLTNQSYVTLQSYLRRQCSFKCLCYKYVCNHLAASATLQSSLWHLCVFKCFCGICALAILCAASAGSCNSLCKVWIDCMQRLFYCRDFLKLGKDGEKYFSNSLDEGCIYK